MRRQRQRGINDMAHRWSLKFFVAAILLCGSLALGSQDNERASVVRAVPPVFPIPQDGKNAMGAVVVEVKIDSSGKVIDAQTVTGHPALRHVAEKAAQRWVFNESTNAANSRSVRLTFMFRLMDEKVADEELVPVFEPPYRIEVRRRLPTISVRST